MNDAEFVLTGSLHVAILCHGYGIPWALCHTEGERLNLPPKWWDLFEFFGVDPDPEKHIVHNITEAREWWDMTGSKIPKPDVNQLIESFPLDKELYEFSRQARTETTKAI